MFNENENKIISCGCDYLAFIDETGDPKLHKDITIYARPTVSPVSTVLSIVILKDDYKNILLPEMAKLKLKYFRNQNVILHSNDIRNKNGVFKVFLNEEIYSDFKKDIILLIKNSKLKIISSSINKLKLLEKYGYDYDIGDIYIKNVEYVFERIGHLAKNKNVKIIFETQGKKESAKISNLLNNLKLNGNFYCNKERFSNIENEILFYKKIDEVNGIEIADYCAYPFSRHAKNSKDENNKLFDFLLDFIYNGDFNDYGIKEWP
jgi:hypothetical protein